MDIDEKLAGWVPYYGGDCDGVIDRLHATLQLDGGFCPAKLWLGLAYAWQSRFDKAIATLLDVARDTTLHPVYQAALGAVHATAGHSDSGMILGFPVSSSGAGLADASDIPEGLAARGDIRNDYG